MNKVMLVALCLLGGGSNAVRGQQEACAVCGEGKQVGAPFNTFVIEGQQVGFCGLLEESGDSGLVPSDLCPSLPMSISDECNCVPVMTLPPVPPPAPTPAPTPRPTQERFCNICQGLGSTGQVGSPDAVVNGTLFSFQDGQPITCGELDENPGITDAECVDLSLKIPIARICDCRSFNGDKPEPCQVCGEGRKVTNPSAWFGFVGLSATCGDIEEAGELGLASPSFCAQIPPFISDVCACEPTSPIAPTPIPTSSPPPPFFCSVCGIRNVLEVGKPENILSDDLYSFQDGQPVSCGNLEAAGKNGAISIDECFDLSRTVNVAQACDCRLPSSLEESDESHFCSLCSEGQTLSNPTAEVFNAAGTFTQSCETIQRAAELGLFSRFQCSNLGPNFAGNCLCEGPTSAPVTTQAPISIAPVLLEPVCSICGPGKVVGDPYLGVDSSIFQLDSNEFLTCQDLQYAGITGLISVEECRFLPSLIHDYCSCQTAADSTEPVIVSSCPACGTGQVMGAPLSLYDFRGGAQPSIPCGLLEAAGERGLISDCFLVPVLIGQACECRTLEPSPPSCSICDAGFEVASPNRTVSFLDSFSTTLVELTTCGDWQYAATSGLVPPETCPQLPELFSKTCECRAVQTIAPVGAPSIGPVPSAPILVFDVENDITSSTVFPTPPPAKGKKKEGSMMGSNGMMMSMGMHMRERYLHGK